MLGILNNRTVAQQSSPAARPRDVGRIYEARDYLARHYVNPPNIPQLARMIGLNRTKLKEGFRETLGFTIYEYILQRRMERAAEMLVSGEHGVAQVAYAVGYDYPRQLHGRIQASFRRAAPLLEAPAARTLRITSAESPRTLHLLQTLLDQAKLW